MVKRRVMIYEFDVFQVVLPYFKSKLHSVYNREREARLQASLRGNNDETLRDSDYFNGGEHALVGGANSNVEVTIRARFANRIQKIIFACYPWLHATSEGTFQVLIISSYEHKEKRKEKEKFHLYLRLCYANYI